MKYTKHTKETQKAAGKFFVWFVYFVVLKDLGLVELIPPKPKLFFPVFADDAQHRVRIGRLFERLAKFGFMKELRDVRQRVEMFLKLTLRNEKKHDEIHRLIVERVEVDARARTAQRTDDFANQIRRGMGNPDAEANAGAHRRLAFLHDGRNRVEVFGFDFSGRDKVRDEFINGFPAVGRLEFRQNLFSA